MEVARSPHQYERIRMSKQDPTPNEVVPFEQRRGIPRLVVGLDVLRGSKEALNQALAFATLIPGTTIDVVWVPPLATGPAAWDLEQTARDSLESSVKEALEEFGTQMLLDADVKIGVVVGEGRPAEELSRIAFLRDASMIIVGSHDRHETALEAFLLGSVSQSLLKQAPCPVLVMRPRSSEALPDIDEPLREDQHRRHVGLPAHHQVPRRPRSGENFPLLFPMGR